MRWTLVCLLTSGTAADGEIVWFWHAHASAKQADDANASRRRR